MNKDTFAPSDQENTEDNAVGLRTRLRLARRDISQDARRRGSLLMRGRLFTWLGLAREAAAKTGRTGPATVAAFWPMADEPDLLPLLQQWDAAGIIIALPVVRTPDAPLVFVQWTAGTPMQTGRHGVQEPQAGLPVQPDLVLVPTLGYTGVGDRLGYGGGYYDRTLNAMAQAGKHPTTIGIAWSQGRLPEHYTPEAHDYRLDAVLTPDGWVPSAPVSTT